MLTALMLMKKGYSEGSNDGGSCCSYCGGASLVHGVQMMNKVKKLVYERV
jgi:hypothetical protein